MAFSQPAGGVRYEDPLGSSLACLTVALEVPISAERSANVMVAVIRSVAALKSIVTSTLTYLGGVNYIVTSRAKRKGAGSPVKEIPTPHTTHGLSTALCTLPCRGLRVKAIGRRPMHDYPVDPSVLSAIRRIIPRGPGYTIPHSGRPATTGGGTLWYTAFHATATIPGTKIERGSFVIHAFSFSTQEDRAAIKGKIARIPRSQFPLISEHIDSLRLVESSWADEGRLARYLRHHCAQRGSDATSPILLVRAIGSAMSEPITASSAESALFELIHAAGGRMPGA